MIVNIQTKYLLKWYALLHFFCVVSCRHAAKDEYPEYYGSLMYKIQSTYNIAKRTSLIDSLQIALRQHPHGVKDLCDFYSVKSDLYRVAGDYSNSIVYLDSVTLILKDELNKPALAVIYASTKLAKSECYLNMKNYDAGMNELLNARNVINSLSDKNHCRFYGYNQRIATMLYKQTRYQLAVNYFKKAMTDAMQCDSAVGKFAGVQGQLDNIGMAYAALDMRDSANHYFQQALDYIKQHEHEFPESASFMPLAKGVVYGNMAKIKRQQKQFAEAEKLCLMAINNTEGTYTNVPLEAQFELVNIYRDWGELEKAERVLAQLDSAQHFSTARLGDDNTLIWFRAMQEIWTKKGNAPAAFRYSLRYQALRDSIDQKTKANIERDMERELENKEQVAMKELLEKENQKKAFQVAIVLILSLFGIVVGSFVWINLQRVAKQERKLQELNSEIQMKNNDLKTAFESLEYLKIESHKIGKMVVHDLKSPLGGIRNMVYTFLRRPQTDEVKRAMEQILEECNQSIIIVNDLLKGNPVIEESENKSTIVGVG